MKRSVVLSYFLAICASAAQAQEAAVGSLPGWQGAYAGADIGWQSSSGRLAVLETGHVQESSKDKLIGGAFAGYNWQVDRWVMGLEGDWSRAGGSSIDFFTARARFGYAIDNLLFYGTAGAGFNDAWVHRHGSGVAAAASPARTGGSRVAVGHRSGAPAGDLDQTVSHLHIGYVVGGGVEAMLPFNLSTRAEILYINGGKTNYDFPAAVGYRAVTIEQSFDKLILRVGLSYHFN